MAEQTGPSYRLAFREWFGLSKAAANVLIALFDAAGELVLPLQISKSAGVAEGAVGVHLVEIRAVLDSEAVDCERGRGYRLTEGGMAECRAALWTMGEELRRAS